MFWYFLNIYRSSHRRFSIEKGVLKNFTKFTGKHLYPSLFFKKVGGLRPTTLLKKTLAQVFSCEFCEIFNNTFFTRHLWTTASTFIYKNNLKKKRIWKRIPKNPLYFWLKISTDKTYNLLVKVGKQEILKDRGSLLNILGNVPYWG